MQRCSPQLSQPGCPGEVHPKAARTMRSSCAGSLRSSTVTGIVCALLCVSASGCVLGNDSDPPVLSVDLLWDRSPQDNRFSEGDCKSAGVVWMNWQLKDEDDQVIASSDDEGQECKDGFDFLDVGPGKYSLTTMGFDDSDQMLWNSTCDNLVLDRFDVLFECKVDQSAP